LTSAVREVTAEAVAQLHALRQQTLWGLLAGLERERGDHDALVAFDDEEVETRWTYAQLADSSRNLAANLVSIGVRRGDRVAIQMTNRPEYVAMYFATGRIGAVAVPINTRLSAPEVKYLLSHSRVRHLVLLDCFRKVDFMAMLAELAPSVSVSIPGALYDEALPELRTVAVMRRDGHPYDGPAYDFRALLEPPDRASAALASALCDQVLPSDIAMIKYTSGSTRFPKGVVLEHGGLIADGLLQSERLKLRGDDRWFSCAPLFHAAGSVWGLLSTFTSGGTLVLSETFSPEGALKLARQEECTIIFGVPPVLRDIDGALRTSGVDLPSVRIIGAAAEPAMAASIRKLLPSVETTINCYGMTEMYANIAMSSPNDSPELQGASCGKIYDGIEYRVVDPVDGSVLGHGEVGEIHVRGFVMRGYWDEPDITAEVFDADGWLMSGDLASVDENGYLTYRGRIKAMLKVGGENVASEEIEQCIAEHTAVKDVSVVSIPDARLDERPLAYVALYEGEDVVADDLRAWCADRLARFKIPAGFVFCDALPRTGNGKIDRPAVQRLADRYTASQQ
jgi:fatty-acyl-CoA synthase